MEVTHVSPEEKNDTGTYAMTSKTGQMGGGHLLEKRRDFLLGMSKYSLALYQRQPISGRAGGMPGRFPRGELSNLRYCQLRS